MIFGIRNRNSPRGRYALRRYIPCRFQNCSFRRQWQLYLGILIRERRIKCSKFLQTAKNTAFENCNVILHYKTWPKVELSSLYIAPSSKEPINLLCWWVRERKFHKLNLKFIEYEIFKVRFMQHVIIGTPKGYLPEVIVQSKEGDWKSTLHWNGGKHIQCR